MKKRKERFVCIDWDDAGFSMGYFDAKDEAFTPIPSQTVGHLVRKNNEVINVAAERFFLSDGSIDYRRVTIIPRKMVKSIRRLE